MINLYLLMAPLYVTTELLIAELIPLVKVPKKNKFILRLSLSILLYYAFSIGVFIIPINMFEFFKYMVIYFASWIPLYMCFEFGLYNILYWSITGLAIQHSSYCTICIVSTIFPSIAFSHGLMIGLLIPIYIAEYFLLTSKANNFTINRTNRYNFIIFIGITVIFVAEFLNSLHSQYSNHQDPMLTIITYVYSLVCCILALFLLFGITHRLELATELATIRQLWNKDKKQFEASEQSIALLNMYCHDLKHIINKNENPELKEALNQYDSMINTQNHALDVILTEKNLYCNNNNIVLTCIVDGKQFDYIKTVDLYSIFGNILDNAIEAVSTLETKDKRTISLIAGVKQDFLYIHSENYYDAKLDIVDGLPVTTKKDRKHHGYGLKSIRHYVSTYDGNMTISTKDNIFCLNIMMPYPSKKDK